MKLNLQKLEGWGYRVVKISYPNFNRFVRYTCVTQTDGQTDGR